jgi:hypothetical protein
MQFFQRTHFFRSRDQNVLSEMVYNVVVVDWVKINSKVEQHNQLQDKSRKIADSHDK